MDQYYGLTNKLENGPEITKAYVYEENEGETTTKRMKEKSL